MGLKSETMQFEWTRFSATSKVAKIKIDFFDLNTV